MPDVVVLSHPNLPDTQTITVAPEAVPHYQRSGWQVASGGRSKRSKSPAEPVPTSSAASPDDKTKE